MQGGSQTLNLGRTCYSESTIIHEFMHALGVWHYQSRPDRDEYVEILFDNIIEDKKHNFNIEVNSETYDTTYDVESFMHYKSYFWAKEGAKLTMKSKVYDILLF